MFRRTNGLQYHLRRQGHCGLVDVRNDKHSPVTATFMIAKMKCSNCGAEMSNLNLSWGNKQLWVVIPLMLVGFFPLIMLTCFKGDITKEVAVSEVARRPNGAGMDIIGLITNAGRHKWTGVTVKAEFYDASGVFLDAFTEYVRADISAGDKEHFKINVRSSEPKVQAADTKLVVKVAGGNTSPF